MKVAVIGTGYVGLPTGVVLSLLGNDVVCVDADPKKIEILNSGECPIFEPGLSEQMKKAIQDGFLRFTTDTASAVKSSDIIFIAVGTPPGPDGTPDMSQVIAVAKDVANAIDHPVVIANKSTVPVGSAKLVSKVLKENGAPEGMYEVVSNPEFLREGQALWDTQRPDRVVIGARTQEAANKLVALYQPLNAPFFITDCESAEMIKYASNSFLATKISFINAISRICENCGANVADVASGMGADKRIGAQFLQAGLGWGGSCFPKDVQGLMKIAEQNDYDFALLREAWNINEDQTAHFMRRMDARLGGLKGKIVAMLGLAFKPQTDDIRDAKSLVMIEHVLASGGKVRAHDPIAVPHVKKLYPDLDYVEHVYDVAQEADVLVVVTEWNEYKQLDLSRLGAAMNQKVLFDGRRMYDRASAEKAGFEYYTIGSATPIIS